MKRFSDLVRTFEGVKDEVSVFDAVLHYLKNSPESEALAGVSLLLGYKPPKLINSETLKELALIYTGYPDYLFEESQAITGDLIETVSLITGNPVSENPVSLDELLRNLLPELKNAAPEKIQEKVFLLWKSLQVNERLLFNRLITGKFRSPVNEHNVIKALSEFYGQSVKTIYIHLEGHQTEKELLNAGVFNKKITEGSTTNKHSFFTPVVIGAAEEISKKSDAWYLRSWGKGMRALLEVTDAGAKLWSDEWRLLNSYFPEIISAGKDLPAGTAFEGELVSETNEPSAALLEKRLRSKNPAIKSVRENKLMFLITDCIQHEATDISKKPLQERLRRAEEISSDAAGEFIRFEKPVLVTNPDNIDEFLLEAMKSGAQGVIVQKANSLYGEGYLIKQTAKTITAALMYAQQGKGNFTGVYSEYSWGIKRGEEFVVIARTNTGLTDEEIIQIDKFVREKRTERLGPVAVVPPEIWAEITYEREEISKRHKAGVVLRNINKVALMKNEK